MCPIRSRSCTREIASVALRLNSAATSSNPTTCESDQAVTQNGYTPRPPTPPPGSQTKRLHKAVTQSGQTKRSHRMALLTCSDGCMMGATPTADLSWSPCGSHSSAQAWRRRAQTRIRHANPTHESDTRIRHTNPTHEPDTRIRQTNPTRGVR